MSEGRLRHILSISGGKDSAALAIYMRDKVPEMEYVFCDTEKELSETYEYLARIEAFLGKSITVLKHDGRGFDHWLNVFGGYLPASNMRWCTKYLKLKPFEKYVGEAPVISYVGIRADEDREGYISKKPNIKAVYPFKEDGLCYHDIERILEETGIGMPGYRKWRSRSGCYFCFFQQKIEWVGLLEHHPELFRLASGYEKTDQATGRRFTWCDNESLEELSRPERVAAIKAEYGARTARSVGTGSRLCDLLQDQEESSPCLVCTL
ncbi:MAG: phosphoadenosine phosphosulfate reductase family protein [Armatimonadetes bacterium]|nr:phosphoadenosine phosphosulfate reductase family protein [Armatimonadota bacterium]